MLWLWIVTQFVNCGFGWSQKITNEEVIIDMVQNMPGDPVGWQQTKYFDPAVLKKIGFTGQTTTGEMSGTQAVDFHSTGHDFFPAGSPSRSWLDAYAQGIDQFILRAKNSGIKAYFFVDLLVFPTSVIEFYKDDITKNGTIVWNSATRDLLNILVDETFSRFPDCDGFIVRTGETYTYDTPYHIGNSPSNNTQALWVDFITALREMVCVQHEKQLVIRSWRNWPQNATYYKNLTDAIPVHPKLYFSIKHSGGDFIRPAKWNPTLGIGKHAQIVEVELQREYEGKGAYPNYVMSGIIDGFPEMEKKIGLSQIRGLPQTRGLWTWSRGGGWWGPYIHGNEIWIDLHAQVLLKWWKADLRLSEPEAFNQACPVVIPGCLSGSQCCVSLRNAVLAAAQAVLIGQWGILGSSPGAWMRDDRIAGLTRLNHHFSSLKKKDLWDEDLDNHKQAFMIWKNISTWIDTDVIPVLRNNNFVLAAQIQASVEYGQRLYAIVEAGWRAMSHGYRKINSLPFDQTELTLAIAEYDARWKAYRAFGLSNLYAASLYHDYYLCLGTECNCAFDPKPTDVPPGIGASMDQLRNMSVD